MGKVLYIADDNEIRSLNPGSPQLVYGQTFQGDASVRIDAMDLHVKTNRIYWTNWHTGRISSYELPPPSPASSRAAPAASRSKRQTESRLTHLEVRDWGVLGQRERLIKKGFTDLYMICV